MTNLERRIAELEGKLARLESVMISKGESKPHHLGDKSKEVLVKEWKSLLNEYKLETMTESELEEWQQKNSEIIDDLLSREDEESNWIIQQVREFRDTVEKINGIRRLL